VARVIALAVAGAAATWALFLARDAILLVYISVLLATGFGPVVRGIEHQRVVPVGTKRLPRWLAILVVYLMIMGTLTGVGIMIVPPLVSQAGELWQRLPNLIERGQDVLIGYGVLDHRITLEEAVRSAPASSGNAMGTMAVALTRVFGGIFGFLTVLILTFYLLVESDSLFAGFARLFPRADRPRVEAAANKIAAKISAWLNGQLILAGTIGSSAAIGLYLLGVPYFYVLALVAAIGEMIPVIGPLMAAIPSIVVALSVSPQIALMTTLFFVVQQQIENHLLVPKVMERQVGVSATIVIVALLIGGSLLGIVGALLAVPTAAILQVIVTEMIDERDRLNEQSLRR
jgi:predicted PurR-regulated permease PerM